MEEVNEINFKSNEFIVNWAAHGNKLHASFRICFNRFIIFSVNENQAKATGCSIDKSVKFIKELELAFNITLLDRKLVAFKKDNKIYSCDLTEFEQQIHSGLLNEYTIVFNQGLKNEKELAENWEIPLKDSGYSRFLQK